MTIPYVPTGDKIFIKPLEQTVSKGGIMLPDMNGACEVAVVLAVGPGRYDSGVQVPVEFIVGDKIIYLKKFSNDFIIEGVKYTLIEERNVIAFY